MVIPDHFTSRLPMKRVAGDCLVVDDAARFLVVQPVYKATWDIPGGVVEIDESPREAARREVREEVGLDVQPGPVLAVDWVRRVGQVTEVLAFLFDGGTSAVAASAMTLPPDEIAAARFVSLAEAATLLDPETHARVAEALSAKVRGTTVYLEDGQPVL